jgi:hypothetical protein
MSDEIGMDAPTRAGVTEFEGYLRHLHDGDKFVALAHIRRALNAEPKNPFYLSYVGFLSAGCGLDRPRPRPREAPKKSAHSRTEIGNFYFA